ncbi:MAG: GyrI-like domain-containing protein [Clostridia bacterium]|nr:GyrI-like domain-containing protein [Clostridia bacterium]
MGVSRVVKQTFTVIGIEGSTKDGSGFIEKLWNEANARFEEIKDLCKRDEDGAFVGFWGAMSDFTHSFKPWEGFSQGLYLAGAECEDNAEAPSGWTKWVVPSFEYLRFDGQVYAFEQAMKYVRDNGFSLAGAVHDFTDPHTGRGYLYVPINRLD